MVNTPPGDASKENNGRCGTGSPCPTNVLDQKSIVSNNGTDSTRDIGSVYGYGVYGPGAASSSPVGSKYSPEPFRSYLVRAGQSSTTIHSITRVPGSGAAVSPNDWLGNTAGVRLDYLGCENFEQIDENEDLPWFRGPISATPATSHCNFFVNGLGIVDLYDDVNSPLPRYNLLSGLSAGQVPPNAAVLADDENKLISFPASTFLIKGGSSVKANIGHGIEVTQDTFFYSNDMTVTGNGNNHGGLALSPNGTTLVPSPTPGDGVIVYDRGRTEITGQEANGVSITSNANVGIEIEGSADVLFAEIASNVSHGIYVDIDTSQRDETPDLLCAEGTNFGGGHGDVFATQVSEVQVHDNGGDGIFVEQTTSCEDGFDDNYMLPTEDDALDGFDNAIGPEVTDSEVFGPSGELTIFGPSGPTGSTGEFLAGPETDYTTGVPQTEGWIPQRQQPLQYQPSPTSSGMPVQSNFQVPQLTPGGFYNTLGVPVNFGQGGGVDGFYGLTTSQAEVEENHALGVVHCLSEVGNLQKFTASPRLRARRLRRAVWRASPSMATGRTAT